MSTMEIYCIWEANSGEDGPYWQLGNEYGKAGDRWVCDFIGRDDDLEPLRIHILDAEGRLRVSLPPAFVILTYRTVQGQG